MNLTQNLASLSAAKEISDSPTVSYQVGWHSTTLCKHGPPQHRTSHQRHEFRTVSKHVCAAAVKKRKRKVAENKIAFRCCLASISVRDKFKGFFFWDVTRTKLMVAYWSFKVHAVQEWTAWSSKTGPMWCPETSLHPTKLRCAAPLLRMKVSRVPRRNFNISQNFC